MATDQHSLAKPNRLEHLNWMIHVRHSLKSSKGDYIGDYIGENYRAY